MEQLNRLQHFQPLVKQRRGVNGDLGPHLPARMVEGLGRGYPGKVGGFAQKRPPGRGQNQLGHALKRLADQGLEQGRVLRIHRQDLSPALPGFLPQQGPRRHHALLVGQGHPAPRLYRSPHPRQPSQAWDGRYHHLSGMGGDLFGWEHREAGKAVLQLSPQGFIGRDNLRAKLGDLPGQGLEVSPRGQPHHPIPPPTADLEGLLTDAAGRAQNDHPLRIPHLCAV
ncbi:hypothetical protein Mgrana_03258 [Meiothermus granaticius NBRC 107808]|uniref:Uncharacterized protein n=1 Tax=Meiothermus granaticius NBRC 107808 TaxID=1227551 RepID=A0A399F0M6_9DEIN|nr:hypothetical protein Mgrana_03258 [Meiothermus granaticius NBRC 107808]